MYLNHVYIGKQPPKSSLNHTLISQSTVGNAGLNKKAQLTFFCEQPQYLIEGSTPCPACFSTTQRLTEAVGPHAGALRCAACDRFSKWAGASLAAQIRGGQA